MARFRSGDLLLKDGQKVAFGTDLDSNVWWDSTASGGSAPIGDLRLDTTISGVDPLKSYHLTTRWYVDDTVSGVEGDTINYLTTTTGVIDHNLLLNLDGDDHTQYPLVDGNRGFTGTVSGVYPVADYDLVTKEYVDNSFKSDNDWQNSVIEERTGGPPGSPNDGDRYLVTSGTGDWAGCVGCIVEWDDYNNEWDFYGPDEGSAVFNEDTNSTQIYHNGGWVDFASTLCHSDLQCLDADDHPQYILVDGSRAFTGTVSGIYPTMPDHLTTKEYVDFAIDEGFYSLVWQNPVLSMVPVASGVATTGNRYISTATGGGWTEDWIMEYTGAAWSGTEPEEGFASWVADEDRVYVYNGTDWVPMASTVTHNNLAGLQGGTTEQRYHLNRYEWQLLVSNPPASGVEDASTLHHHDSRYYTEEEMNTTLSGYVTTDTTQTITGDKVFNNTLTTFLGDVFFNGITITMSGTTTNNTHGATHNYDDSTTINNAGDTNYTDGSTVTYETGSTEIHEGGSTTIFEDNSTTVFSGITNFWGDTTFESPTIFNDDVTVTSGTQTTVWDFTVLGDTTLGNVTFEGDIILASGTAISGICHSNLDCLENDDHTQYVLVDGTRGFTSTVSGVTPTEDYHLATKGYVDDLTVSGGIDRMGTTAIANGASQVTVNFADIVHTNYYVNATMVNQSDSPPSIYAFIITNKTSSSFTADFMGDMDSSNYYLDWIVVDDEV